MAQCQVTVTVTDENDHAPLITITNVATTQLDNGKRKASVMSPLVGNAPKLTHTAERPILQHGAKMHTSECAALL